MKINATKPSKTHLYLSHGQGNATAEVTHMRSKLYARIETKIV